MSRDELTYACIWEALRADWFQNLGSHYREQVKECRQLSAHYTQRLESLDQEAE
ncbi:hypothetical protein SynBIOSE41_01081 [Synechococcus sp. BIOS-E4-1]|nr:hypothetical protein SynBIOSE41_01081 [Synechococcus sp. BIOS-E4-1]